MKKELNEGMMANHHQEILIDLFAEIRKYFSNHQDKDLQDKIFNSLLDLLNDKPDHFLWDRFTEEHFNENTMYNRLNSLAEQIKKEGMYIKKNDKLIAVPQDKQARIVWDTEYKTSKGILVRTTKRGLVSIKSLTPNGLIFKKKDYENFCKDMELQIEELTWQQLERVIQDFRTGKNYQSFWKKYPSMNFFIESLEVEKNLEPVQVETTGKYTIKDGYNSMKKTIKKDNSSSTFSVFDI